MVMGRLTWHCSLLILFFFVHFQVNCVHSDQTPINSSSHHKECLALLQFKNITYRSFPHCVPCSSEIKFDAPCFKTDPWMDGRDCCSWPGVWCERDDTSNYVVGLDLGYSCLKGTLNLSILFQLPRLKRLDLSGNRLAVIIPASLSKLETLSWLDLSRNMMSGQFPDYFTNLRQLSFLDLSENNFSGPIPHSICELPNLCHLDLSDNFLNGGVPFCLFNMPSLSTIDLSINQLTGPIGKFKLTSSALKELNLGSNKINGPIPSSIFELVNLTYLGLSSNNLIGTLKLIDMLSKFRFLENLDLSGNRLLSFSFKYNNVNVKDIASITLVNLRLSSCNISIFPSSLSSLVNLKWLDLSNNRIQGQIVKNGSDGWVSLAFLDLSYNFLTYIEHLWKNIDVLYLHNNRLQGSLSVPPLRIRVFLVSNNNFTGKFPPSFCNLSSTLNILDLSNNNLGGKILECLGSFIGLRILQLQNNNFQGKIPNTFANGSVLASLDLSGNHLEGSLPRSLNSCCHLEVINMGNNNISDIFPYWLGTLPILHIIILKSNQLYGPIYDFKTNFTSLRILDLSYNKFVGRLSKTFFEHLEAMMSTHGDSDNKDMYMVSNCDFTKDGHKCTKYYYDYLLSSLSLVMKGQLIKFQRVLMAFRAIDLSNNCFEGRIPEILGYFKSLIVLNLSHNSLTGNIPSSFGNMIALESLDLSSNKLDGRIPMQMESLTFLAVLNLSHNKLLGLIPQGGQFATYESTFFTGNKGLCGKPLLEKCSNDLVPLLPASILQVEDDTIIEFDWKIMMMGYGCGLVIGLSIGYIMLSIGKLRWLEMMVEGRLQKKFRRTS